MAYYSRQSVVIRNNGKDQQIALGRFQELRKRLRWPPGNEGSTAYLPTCRLGRKEHYNLE